MKSIPGRIKFDGKASPAEVKELASNLESLRKQMRIYRRLLEAVNNDEFNNLSRGLQSEIADAVETFNE